ncbi:MAG: ATP-binding cassette domain-containing protein [Fuscovulum sp.]|nr:ATP-binding cassette domain-containing protein [Fuscovulum sp.]
MSQVSCKGVRKVFGPQAEALFQNTRDKSRITAEGIASAGGLAAVQDINLEVAEGEILIIMSLSGSGKSTLLRCLCRLVANPDVWLLDEPFSALDPPTRREMQDKFVRLQRMLKKTIVFVTHDFDEAARVADRICIMRDGRVIQTATVAELILSPADGYVQRSTEKAVHVLAADGRPVGFQDRGRFLEVLTNRRPAILAETV